ncbi:MAG: hypothetical protein RLZZ127_1992 [Planctomycetota bacterium]|jgi:hypothetical protein
MTAHTPAPWTVRTARAVVGGAVIPEIGAVLDLDQRHPEVNMANARLAAAAPEMLAALKAILAFDEMSDCSSESGSWQSVGLSDAFDTVRAAIAKAEGRA